MAGKEAKEKVVNYSPETTAAIIKDYAAGVTVEEIAAKVGRSVRSVVAKLSREGVYKKKEYKTKTGVAPVKKDTQADEIGMLLGLNENDTDSLAKANKAALAAIVAALRERNADILEQADEDAGLFEA